MKTIYKALADFQQEVPVIFKEKKIAFKDTKYRLNPQSSFFEWHITSPKRVGSHFKEKKLM